MTCFCLLPLHRNNNLLQMLMYIFNKKKMLKMQSSIIGQHTLQTIGVLIQVATSSMRSKVCDHCILRSLVGQKSRDYSSLCHIRRYNPNNPKKLSSLHGFLHGKPCQWYGLWMRIKDPHKYMVMALGSYVEWPIHKAQQEILWGPIKCISVAWFYWFFGFRVYVTSSGLVLLKWIYFLCTM